MLDRKFGESQKVRFELADVKYRESGKKSYHKSLTVAKKSF